MNVIQWFPGHMTKAMRMMEKEIALIDVILFVLDARAPIATYNKELKKISKNKPILFLMNKSDLADREESNAIMQLYRKNSMSCMQCVATKSKDMKNIALQIQTLLKDKIARDKIKFLHRVPKIMVVGIPNTGKSTLINSLVGEKRAITGNKVGVTRGKQWVRCEHFELLDTPGTLVPYFENQILAQNVAFIGSVNDNILNIESIAMKLLETLQENYPHLLQERYKIQNCTSIQAMFDEICKNRGFLLKGATFDYERTAKIILDDFRKGRIGYITLEKAKDYQDFFKRV